jgi:hypothetical protein
MFRNMLHSMVLAGAVTVLFGLPASADSDYIPKNAVPFTGHGVVHVGPVDCMTARKIIRQEGYSGIKQRNCSGETYRFRAQRSGHMVELRVDRQSGAVMRGHPPSP